MIGLDDELFLRNEKIPMTKKEIRTLTICQAMIKENDIILDIGAGTGSLSIEAALLAKNGFVFSAEKNEVAISLIKDNIKKFNLENKIKVIEGNAPKSLEKLNEMFDVIMIGGSGGAICDILQYALDHLKEKGRIVLNAITLQNATETINFFKENKISYEATLIQASRLRQVGKIDMMIAQNPVYIIKAQK